MTGRPLARLLLIPTLVGIAAGSAGAQPLLYRSERPAMGSTVAISVYSGDSDRAGSAIEAAFEEIERVEQLLSDYRSTSELSRINRTAAAGPVTVDPELFALLERVLDLQRSTGGAFDPAVGALVDAWGFRTDAPSVPDRDALEWALARSGMRLVALDPSDRTVLFLAAGVRIDPGAFGKGYAVDRAARVLQSSGIEAALVNAGGSTFRALEAPPGESGWRVRLAGPADSLLLRNAGLSVSGQSERRFTSAGTTYGHIIDPRTGNPAPAGRLAVAIAPNALDADALSTALYVLGPAGASRAVAGRDDLCAIVRPAPVDASEPFRRCWPRPGAVAGLH